MFYSKKISFLFAVKKKMSYLCSHKNNGSVAQLYRVADYGSAGYRLESCRSHEKNAAIAKL